MSAEETSPLISKTTSRPLAAEDPSTPATRLENFDQILDHVGTFGPWQMLAIALLWLPPFGAGVIVLLWSFAGLEPKAFRYIFFQLLDFAVE